MRKLYILIFALSLFTGTAFGQMVKGHVYDAETHEPLPGVNITYKKINGDTNGTISDADGAYEIALPDGGIDLLFSYIGYENEQLPLILRKGDTKTKDVYMNIKTNLLGDVVVSAGRFEQKLSDVTVSMDLLKAGDIAKQAPTDLSSTLNTMPGVDINDKQPSIRGGNGWTYGVGSRSLVLVDGMSALSSGNGVINWNIVPLENIEQVEVMKGASSVLYGSSALNGVINIRTKRPGLTPTTSARAYVGVYDHPVHDEYEGADVSHARRIGNFDVSGGLNLFSDDGYRDQGYNRRLRLGGNMTYHHPMKEGKLLNYGFNFNYLADKYADFFIWRSPVEVYQPSSIANMGRKGNTFYIDPFFNFTNPTNNTSHKIKTRFYYRGDNIIDGSSSHKSLDDILGNMGSDAVTVNAYIDNIKNGDYSPFFPLIQPILQGDLNGIVDGAVNILNGVFPTATTADYCDLISWVMNNNKENVPKGTDKNYTYYVDYQFNKKWDSGSQITAGATYEHMKSVSKTTGTHDSDNAALFVRAGLNYQLADYSFIRASFGQGYRYPSLTEKYARKDIGGVGVYPNKEVNAEKGVNAELGFKQGYKFGNLTGFFDLAGFYTQYTDMIEFRFGIFNNTTFQYINGVRDLLSMITQGQMPGFGAQFYNVSKARIYGAEVSTNGVYTFNPNTTLSYNLGYVFIEPEDADYKKKNEEEATYDDPMQMKEKSNTSKYLKYRQKHTVKAILDFQWKRLTLGTNIVWKSKTLAVDYLMVDERTKEQPEIMDYVRDILFGNVNGQTLHSYWAKNNTPYCVVDLRAGVKIMKGLSFQFMVNNLFNKEYSTRPMLVSAPRTYVMQLSANF